MSLKMIDISGNNHGDDKPINWKAVKKAGYVGVIIKATEGTNYTNPWLKNDAAGAHAQGMHIGYYHFAHPGESDPTVQAEYFLKQIFGLPRDIGGTLDLELTEGKSWAELTAWGKSFLDILAANKIVDTNLYVNGNFLDNLSGAPWGHKLWFASPGVTPRMHCWMWQKSWTGQVPGIVGDVDIDAYNG